MWIEPNRVLYRPLNPRSSCEPNTTQKGGNVCVKKGDGREKEEDLSILPGSMCPYLNNMFNLRVP